MDIYLLVNFLFEEATYFLTTAEMVSSGKYLIQFVIQLFISCAIICFYIYCYRQAATEAM